MAVYPCVYREHEFNWISIITRNRFIPVYTGNTPDDELSDDVDAGLSLCIQGTLNATIYIHLCSPVYPCVYREHIVKSYRGLRAIGLSLCIQGTLYSVFSHGFSSRFIPVYTGNMPIAPPNPAYLTVYPCVYREHTNYNILFYN